MNLPNTAPVKEDHKDARRKLANRAKAYYMFLELGDYSNKVTADYPWASSSCQIYDRNENKETGWFGVITQEYKSPFVNDKGEMPLVVKTGFVVKSKTLIESLESVIEAKAKAKLTFRVYINNIPVRFGGGTIFDTRITHELISVNKE